MNDLPNRLLRLFEEVHCETSVEFISLALDMRPAVYTSLEDDEKTKIKEIFPEFEIRRELINFGDKDFNLDFVYKKINDKSVNEKIDGICLNVNNEVIGQILGYPDCCVQNHILKDPSGPNINRPRDPILVSSGFDENKPIPFVMNRFLNFSTRIRGGDIADYYRYLEKNKKHVEIQGKNIYFSNIGFISHIPCSADCAGSLSQAEVVAEWMKINMPEMYDYFESALKRPFLYLGAPLNFVSFDGIVKDKQIIYSGKSFEGFLDERLEQAIEEGNRIAVDNDKVIVSRDNETILIHQKENNNDGVIINFV